MVNITEIDKQMLRNMAINKQFDKILANTRLRAYQHYWHIGNVLEPTVHVMVSILYVGRLVA